jgi:hypothetical protein
VKGWLVLLARQIALVVGAILCYFGVRGFTERAVGIAKRNAQRIIDVEQALQLDFERNLQRPLLDHRVVLDLANWAYIWLHWPLITATLIWLLVRHRPTYFELRNAMFISGAIGLVIFATFPAAPPRLFDSAFVDTVTQHSHSYRVLQPPGLVNKYAAMPSLHVGWNLLAAIAWWRASTARWRGVLVVIMPLTMAWATIATANHWVLDALAGSAVALAGLAIETARRRWLSNRAASDADALGGGPVEGGDQAVGGDADGDVRVGRQSGDGNLEWNSAISPAPRHSTRGDPPAS